MNVFNDTPPPTTMLPLGAYDNKNNTSITIYGTSRAVHGLVPRKQTPFPAFVSTAAGKVSTLTSCPWASEKSIWGAELTNTH